jgi:Family of unknown function (DUF6304)
MAEMNAIYKDKDGEVPTIIRNDGKTLSTKLRNVEFSGPDFESLTPVDGTDPALLTSFTLNKGDLCACTIDAEMLLPVLTNGETTDGSLAIHLELGDPAPNGGIDKVTLSLALTLGQFVHRSRGTSGWFEDELLDIQRQLSEGTHLKACITCAYSDYSPAGHGLFGHLMCFRGNKVGYLKVKGKFDLFRISPTMTEWVQETHLCPEFERRQPGTGYRG